MKKIIILLCIITTMTCTSFAENQSRWYWIFSDDEVSVYLDMPSIDYNKTFDVLTCNIKSESVNQNLYAIYRTKVYFRYNEAEHLTKTLYSIHPAKMIQYTNYTNYRFEILPGTENETIINKLSELMGRNVAHEYP